MADNMTLVCDSLDSEKLNDSRQCLFSERQHEFHGICLHTQVRVVRYTEYVNYNNKIPY